MPLCFYIQYYPFNMVDSGSKNSLIKFLLPFFGSLAIYIAISYFLERDESVKLVLGFTILFIAYLSIYFKATTKKQILFLVYAAILIRLSLLFSLPNLSDDFYRFIWDGRVILNGIHPFAYLPAELVLQEATLRGIDQTLYENLNSPGYFTIYPPVCQLVFTLAAFLSIDSILGSVIIMRIIIILAEIASFCFIYRLSIINNRPPKVVLLYALNPLVIVELTGNLHFEALLVTFLLAGIYYLQRQKLVGSAFFFSLAICTKLLPLIFLPLLIKRLGIKKAFLYYLLVGIFCLMMFLPLLSPEWINGFSSSFMLYFQKFEFNASIYYLLREAGYLLLGMNIIFFAGILLALTVIYLIVYYSFWEDPAKISLFESFTWILLIYLLFTTTFHPWYLIPFLALSIFTRYRFPVVWSFLIFLTYLNYYEDGFSENLWIVTLEYVVTLVYLIFEISSSKRFKNLRHRFGYSLSYIVGTGEV